MLRGIGIDDRWLTMLNRFKFWGAEIADELPEVDYEAVMESDKGVAIWVHKIVCLPAFKSFDEY